jgi:hypothetical protein
MFVSEMDKLIAFGPSPYLQLTPEIVDLSEQLTQPYFSL